MTADPNDPRSCLCCGEHLVMRRRKRPKHITYEHVQIAIEELEHLGYTKEDMLGPFKAHLDWQMPGLAEWIRKGLS